MFDAIEARANASVFKALANARALIGGSSVAIVFDPARAYANDLGVVTQQPEFEAPFADVQAVAEGTVLTINAASYRVRQVLQLDEGLRARVVLAKV